MLALSEPHKPELPETLAKLKLQFSPVILARTVAADLNDLDIKKFDLLALYSPSDVKAILERFPPRSLPAVATFGEGTLRAAVDVGIKVKAMAPTPTVPSMAKAVDIYLTKLAKGEQIEDVAVTHDADKEEFIRTQQHKLAKKSRTRRTTPAEKK